MKKTKEKKYTVIRSGQERKNYWDFGPDKYCAGTIQCPIETGDYGIKELKHNILSIERKFSVGEIYQNLFEKRFERELDRLEKFKYKFIICQFESRDILSFPYNSGIPQRFWDGLKANGEFIMSKLAGITIKRNIPVIFGGPGEASKNIALFYLRQVARAEGLI